MNASPGSVYPNDDDSEVPASGGPFSKVNSLLARQADVALALAVICVLGLLVFRIPPLLLDTLLAINIAISALVLLLALYVRDIKQFPSFPTIILLTTLFRLALNVTTTRLILLEAHGGEIIEAFGQFVVGGNLIVGGVVFILLVIVQFIVIAKGSERVSEVGARFSLDAMPGKQMTIDGDLRSGNIDLAEATRRRDDLTKESKLYGAMEGAMKFVKGDAIAGIIISAVNIAAGIVLGVTQMGMTASESVETYSLLTIGDGLVSQIPSIIICVSAGIVVTKVVSDEKASVATDIVAAVFSNVRAVAILAVLLAVLAWVPGFPTAVFLGLAVVVGCIWWAAKSRAEHALRATIPVPILVSPDEGAPRAALRSEDPSEGSFGSERDVGLSLGAGLNEILESAGFRRQLWEEWSHRLGELGTKLGVDSLRLVDDRALAEQVPSMGYAIVIRGTVAAVGEVDVARVYLEAPIESIRALGLEPDLAKLPWRAVPGCAIPFNQLDVVVRSGFRNVSTFEYLAQHMESVVRRNANSYFTIERVGKLLSSRRDDNSDLPTQLKEAGVKHAEIANIFQQLLRDGFPVAEHVLVLEAIAKHAASLKGKSDDLYQQVRAELAGPMCRKLLLRRARESKAMRFYRLDPALTNMLSEESRNGSQSVILNRRLAETLERSIRESLDPARSLLEDPVLLVPRELRAMMSRHMRECMPQITILAQNEVRGDFPWEEHIVMLSEA